MNTTSSKQLPLIIRIQGLVLFALLVAFGTDLRANPSLHAQVLVFVPAYEGSQLFDPNLTADKNNPACVWGNYNVFLSSQRYFSLRTPNPLEAQPLMSVGPIDVYRGFVDAMTHAHADASNFTPYTEGSDFFVFAYDWRQEIATVSAPLLEQALQSYARIHERKTGIPARDTQFVIVAHSMGGLVARTLICEKPAWASRISRLYLVGTPNTGSVKAIRTVVVGPDTLSEFATGFPGVLLNLLPTDVDQHVTKLVGITRPSLYELLPIGDPHWQAIQAAGESRHMTASDVLSAASWESYWPSAQLEKKLFIEGWLKDRIAEGRKQIDPARWEYCQDSSYTKLKAILAQVSAWRHIMGPLSHTENLLTRFGETSRLRVVLSTGLKTPTGVITQGAHDEAEGSYTYETNGDGTVEAVRVIDDLGPGSALIQQIYNVPHGKLMIDPQFLTYFTQELSGQLVTVGRLAR